MSLKRCQLSKYGLDELSYRKMFFEQGGVCLICGLPETATHRGKTRSLSVDHCHFSGKVRALLCCRCNQTLGRAKDNPKLLRRMAEYLESKVTFPPVCANLITEAQKFEKALSQLSPILQDVAKDVFLNKLPQKEIADKHGKKQPWVSCQVGIILKSLSTVDLSSPFSTREPRKRSAALSLAERQRALKRRILRDTIEKLRDIN